MCASVNHTILSQKYVLYVEIAETVCNMNVYFFIVYRVAHVQSLIDKLKIIFRLVE